MKVYSILNGESYCEPPSIYIAAMAVGGRELGRKGWRNAYGSYREGGHDIHVYYLHELIYSTRYTLKLLFYRARSGVRRSSTSYISAHLLILSIIITKTINVQ